MNGPYHIEVERDGCRFCGKGKTYWVVGSDDVADGTTFEDEEEALELADMLNDAFEKGQQSVTKPPESKGSDEVSYGISPEMEKLAMDLTLGLKKQLDKILILERVCFRGQKAVLWEKSLDGGETWEMIHFYGNEIPFCRIDTEEVVKS